MVKSAKRAILAILGNADVNDEELLTAFISEEGLLNSRPLVDATCDINDEGPLTSNHFLFGQTGGAVVPNATDSTPFTLTRRWRYVQELVRQFWKR